MTVINDLDNGGLDKDNVEKLMASNYIPQLIRHIQLLSEGLKVAQSTMYIKVGTTGTGGMGLNIPYTHSEDKPSRVLLSKNAVAGAVFIQSITKSGLCFSNNENKNERCFNSSVSSKKVSLIIAILLLESLNNSA